jgi:hypothetical protein
MARPLLKPADSERILLALTQRHGRRLDGERFEVEGHLDGKLVVVALTLSNGSRTFVYRMEAAVSTEDRGVPTVDEAVDLCFDFLDWYLEEYFREARELLLPLDFQPHRFGDLEILARGDVHNEVLDELADAWLRGERPEVPRRLK